VDPGTFGGPQSFLNLPAVPLTSSGALLGSADTSTHDADYPKCNPFMVRFPDRYLTHAFEWRSGRLRDLGALPGNNSSAIFEVNWPGLGRRRPHPPRLKHRPRLTQTAAEDRGLPGWDG
jgi:hypothetical protein